MSLHAHSTSDLLDTLSLDIFGTTIMVVKHPCLSCRKAVAKSHHGLACEVCNKWCHRACGTGYSTQEYKMAVESKIYI